MSRFMSLLGSLSGCAMLALRLMMASIVIVSGYYKFFVFGMEKLTANFQGYGMPVPQITGPFIGVLELAGGILLALGWFTRYLGVLYFFEFIVAWWVKFSIIPAPAGGYAGARLDAMLIVTALVFATQGAGRFSVDAKLGRG